MIEMDHTNRYKLKITFCKSKFIILMSVVMLSSY